MNDKNNIMCLLNYDMCYVQDIMCCVQYDNYDDAYYSHVMTFLLEIFKAH